MIGSIGTPGRAASSRGPVEAPASGRGPGLAGGDDLRPGLERRDDHGDGAVAAGSPGDGVQGPAALYAGQFALLFRAMSAGLSPGLAAVVIQSQAVFTVLAARRPPRARSADPARVQTGSAVVDFTVFMLIRVRSDATPGSSPRRSEKKRW